MLYELQCLLLDPWRLVQRKGLEFVTCLDVRNGIREREEGKQMEIKPYAAVIFISN